MVGWSFLLCSFDAECRPFAAAPNATLANANGTNSSELLLFQEDQSGGADLI